jgi:myosin I
LDMSIGQHPHYQGKSNYFTVKHYAGQVTYDIDGFCEANKDTLFRDLIMLAQSTNNSFIRNLFPEDIAADDKKRPTTAGFKIRVCFYLAWRPFYNFIS